MDKTYYSYGIVGFGIAGQLLVLELVKRGIKQDEICIFDENFLGGALVTRYGSVLSNTPWSKTKRALMAYPLWSAETIAEGDKKYKEEDCMPLRDVGKYCLEVSLRSCPFAEKLTTRVEKLEYITENNCWKIQHSYGEINCKYLFLGPGGTEKQIQFDKPQIPLSIALDKYSLDKIISAEKDTVAVFGLSHSGTICLQNLQELGVKTIGIYNTEKPFIFARDGDPNGIKEASEKIADNILAGKFKNCKLISYNNFYDLSKSLLKCTKIISCIGFNAREIGGKKPEYNSDDAKVNIGPNCYGYGIAFPKISIHNGSKYPEVSVLAFQEQIINTLASILNKN
jgi:hypothetical protein